MKILSTILGFDLGGAFGSDSKMETNNTAKKEATASKPAETNKPPAELTPVRNFLIMDHPMFIACI